MHMTDIVMSPLEFIQRLAALVPRPRVAFDRFHGVLRNARPRPDIIPNVSVNAKSPSADHAELPPPAVLMKPGPACSTKPPRAVLNGERRPEGRKARHGFRKRVFEIDMEHCSQCGGTLKIIAAIEYQPVIANIFTHLGLPPSTAPSMTPIDDPVSHYERVTAAWKFLLGEDFHYGYFWSNRTIHWSVRRSG